MPATLFSACSRYLQFRVPVRCLGVACDVQEPWFQQGDDVLLFLRAARISSHLFDVWVLPEV